MPALLRLEQDLVECTLPERPLTAKAVKEYMFIDTKVNVKLWKPGKIFAITKEDGDTEGEFLLNTPSPISYWSVEDVLLRKELNMEVMVMDEKVKAITRGKSLLRNTKDWMVPWRRTVHITGLPKAFSRALPFLNYHTSQWGKSTDPSESRSRKETICSALAEYTTVMKYRHDLFKKDDSASAWIRAYIDTNLVTVVAKGKGRPYSSAEGQEDAVYTLTWPDGIDYDHAKIPEISPFNIVVETSLIERKLSRERDTDSIQKIIRAIQMCPPAWNVVPGEDLNDVSAPRGRMIRPEILQKAKELITVRVTDGPISLSTKPHHSHPGSLPQLIRTSRKGPRHRRSHR